MMGLQDRLDQKESEVHQDFLAFLEPQGFQVFQDRTDLQDRGELQGVTGQRGTVDFQETLAFRGYKGFQVLPVYQVPRGTLVKSSHQTTLDRKEILVYRASPVYPETQELRDCLVRLVRRAPVVMRAVLGLLVSLDPRVTWV